MIPRIKSMIWNIRKQKTTNQNNKKKKNPKNEDSESNFWDNFKHSNISSTGVSEGEEKEQETGNLFEKIMKEPLPPIYDEENRHTHLGSRVPN